MTTGSPPKTWANGVPELMVSDFQRSFSFWTQVIGFGVAYQRAAQNFAYLEHPDGAQIMLWQNDGDWETAKLEPPFGRGVVLQIYVGDVDAVSRRVRTAGLPFYREPYEKWRDWGDRMGGQRE
ncbi:MAG: VOC family protein, partial [Deltaproteobacteria bacterium]